MKLKEIRQPGAYSYVFSKYAEPVVTVQPGETVAIYTKDAFEDRVSKPTDRPSAILDGDPNPQTGPIFIKGAEPGDTLAVHLLTIEATRDYAVSAHKPGLGGLTPTASTPMLAEPMPEKVYIYKIKDGMVTYNEKMSYPWRPFIGTIATAPRMEALSALTPFTHGGNMDTPETKPGNIVYLPVNVPGAYFYTGDVHAGQGDGELCGFALEIAAKVTVQFELIKGKSINWPRIESPTELMVIGSARPMEDAARIAYMELIEWMTEYGWDKYDAHQALSQIGKMSVGNMVDTYYSLVAKIEKKYV